MRAILQRAFLLVDLCLEREAGSNQVENAGFLGHPLGGLSCSGEDLLLVHKEHLPVLHNKTSVDHHSVHISSAAGEHQVVDVGQAGRHGGGVSAYHDQVRLFPNLQGTDLIRPTDGSGAADGGHLDHVIGGENSCVQGGVSVEQGTQLHRFDHVLTVVGGGAVHTKTHVDTHGNEVGNGGGAIA